MCILLVVLPFCLFITLFRSSSPTEMVAAMQWMAVACVLGLAYSADNSPSDALSTVKVRLTTLLPA